MKISLTLALICGAAVSALMGATLAFTAGASDFIILMVAALFAVFSIVPKGMDLRGSFGNVTITDILTEYGNYYKKGSQNLKDIRIKLMQPSVTEQFFTPRLTDSTRLELANVYISRVLQSYQSGFTKIGDTTFTPNVINLDHMKIDVSILPHDIMESWLGFLVENAQTPKDTPLVKFWLEQLVLAKYQEDLENEEIFHGKKVAIVAGTAGATRTAMNGVKEKLKGTGVQVITMGAVSTDPVLHVEYVEDFIKNIPELIRGKIDAVAMNSTQALLFQQGMRAKYNMHYAQSSDLLKLMDFDIKVQGLPSMNGHTTMFATPKDNRIIANKNPKNQSTFDVQADKREVNALTDFHKGVGFWSNNLVFRTDVSLT